MMTFHDFAGAEEIAVVPFVGVLAFGAPCSEGAFQMRIGRGSSVTVIDFESLPVTMRTGTGARGTSGSLRSDRSNSSVYLPTGSDSNVAVLGPVIRAIHSRP